MPQSSLTAWLKKPAAVTQPAKGPSQPDEKAVCHVNDHAQLPPPPQPSSGEQNEQPEPTKSAPSSFSDGWSKPSPTPPHPALPPNIHLRKCIAEDTPAFKRLNTLLLPIPYPESFYKEILSDPLTSDLTLLAFWRDNPALKDSEKGRLVGAIRCRLLTQPPPPTANTNIHTQTKSVAKVVAKEVPMLYLSTLVLLSPYRHYGVASHMLNVLTRRAIEGYGIRSVGAHVWEANAEGLEWYRKRGFREVGREEGYYGRLRPSGAVVVRREVGVMDLVGGWGGESE